MQELYFNYHSFGDWKTHMVGFLLNTSRQSWLSLTASLLIWSVSFLPTLFLGLFFKSYFTFTTIIVIKWSPMKGNLEKNIYKDNDDFCIYKFVKLKQFICNYLVRRTTPGNICVFHLVTKFIVTQGTSFLNSFSYTFTVHLLLVNLIANQHNDR